MFVGTLCSWELYVRGNYMFVGAICSWELVYIQSISAIYMGTYIVYIYVPIYIVCEYIHGIYIYMYIYIYIPIYIVYIQSICAMDMGTYIYIYAMYVLIYNVYA